MRNTQMEDETEMTSKFKPRPLFGKKKKLPGGFKLPKPGAARPSRPIKGSPLLPFDDALKDAAQLYFAKGIILKDMRETLHKEDS